MSRHRIAAASEARPFLKWAGGKTQLLPALDPLLPRLTPDATYHEPFLGSGALFFHLVASGRLTDRRAVLTDTVEDLVTTWTAVRDEPRELGKRLAQLGKRHSPEQFYRERDNFNEMILAPTERAALVIYLNKTCFNGLYRLNASGKFNVPCGKQASGPALPDDELLAACSSVLQGVTILCEGFERVLDRAVPGDFVYFDPPYVPVSVTSSFTAYSAGGFGGADQERLRDVFVELDRRGCHVMLSNSDTPAARALYASFRIDDVQARRAINSKTSARGRVGELVVRNYASSTSTPHAEAGEQG